MRRSNFCPGSALPATPAAALGRSSFEPGSNLHYYWAPRPPGDYSSAHPLSPWDAARILRGRGGRGQCSALQAAFQSPQARHALKRGWPQKWQELLSRGWVIFGVAPLPLGIDCGGRKPEQTVTPTGCLPRPGQGRPPLAGRAWSPCFGTWRGRRGRGWPVRRKPWSYRTGIWAALRRGIGAPGTPKS